MNVLSILILIALFGLAVAFIFLKMSEKKEKKVQKENKKDLLSIADDKEDEVFSTQDFLDFDRIANNMIIREKGNKYTMVLSCSGVNYDLMSENEQNIIEEGFCGLLNFIQFPIQLYIQTRQVDLKDSIRNYEKRVVDFRVKLNKLIEEYNTYKESIDVDQQKLRILLYQIQNQQNLYEYAYDLKENIERMSISNNVLQQRYYICITYKAEEIGILTDIKIEEIEEIAEQELYNRCSSISSALLGCGIESEVLDSNRLAELLYMAFNRDDGETYRLKDCMESGFYRLFSTIRNIDEKRYEEYAYSDKEKQAEELKVKNINLENSDNQLVKPYKGGKVNV